MVQMLLIAQLVVKKIENLISKYVIKIHIFHFPFNQLEISFVRRIKYKDKAVKESMNVVV